MSSDRYDYEGSFDWHRAMTDAVVEAPHPPPKGLIWVMSEKSRAEYRHFMTNVMGLDDEDSESFGIPIETGDPSNGERFELVLRPS